MDELTGLLEMLIRNAGTITHENHSKLNDEIDSLLSAAQWVRYYATDGKHDLTGKLWKDTCARMDELMKHHYPQRPRNTPPLEHWR